MPSFHLHGTPSCAVEVTSPATRDVWWDLLRRDELALVTQTPTWLDCLCDAWPFVDASRLYRFSDGGHLLVPMVRHRGRLPGLLAEESWPRWGVGGAVGLDGAPDAGRAHLVLADLAARPALRVAVRFNPRTTASFRVDSAGSASSADSAPLAGSVWEATASGGFATVERTTYLLDLSPGFDAVWSRRFHPSVRQGVRRAERAAVEVTVDRTGRLVPLFQRLHRESVARWAEQQHEPLTLARWRQRRDEPPRLLEAVAERFGESCAIWLASVEGQPAAAIVVLRHGTHAKYWRGAMDRSVAGPVHANQLLHRLAVEDACAAGCLVYDMGDARAGSSLARFKENLGARPVPSPAYYRERLPLTAFDRRARAAVKRLIGFRDA
ncbi:GNAT family N-acetyltransferase [Streptacidiphilus neutrinimicus]|uniref:GNAT family N-acetyltransferase n=1 Tax=Streptacidiphilus neutrinimicus TaxID=105420 RepID=UPI0005A839C4|nr:GNAT family N-acetyltransferase [Streptacidiphilus neutrinimicus]